MSNDTAISKKQETSSESIRGRWVVAPPVDIFENDDSFLIRTDLPGVRAEDVDIRLEKGELIIRANWSRETVAGESLAREFRDSDYERRFSVPDTIDADAITADLSLGILRVTLPKSEAVKPRRIQVRAG